MWTGGSNDVAIEFPWISARLQYLSLALTQWVINYHQHNYHQQKMAAASSGKGQQWAISLFLGLPAS